MRVLHIGKYFPPAPGGIETYLGDLCACLADQGVHSHVLCHRLEPSEPAREEPKPGVVVERVAVAASVCYSLIAPSYPFRLRRALRQVRPDVIHAHLPNLSAFSCLLPGMGVPLVLHWHSDVAWPEDKRLARLLYHGYAPVEAALLRRANRVVATSQAYLAGSTTLAPYHDKCRVIPLGVHENRLHVPDEEAVRDVRMRWLGKGEGSLVVSAGRFAHYKGFEHLVRAMRRVPDAVLVMVGDGETREYMKSLSDDPSLGGRVRLAGRLPDADLHALLAAADVFCLPSVERSEAFGVVLLEAMALGTCCLCTDIPGSAPGWVVRHEKTGLVVRPGDEGALAAGLRRLLEDPVLRSRLAQAGRERFVEHFRIQATVPAMCEVYEEATRAMHG